MDFGKWDINVTVGKMPQRVASAVAKLNEVMLGAGYKVIAYLGSQVVNGTNHAVLAEQTVVTGYDSKNVVILVFNEKPNDVDLTLVGIDRVLESGAPLGGIVVDAQYDIPQDMMDLWNDVFQYWVGSYVVPFAYLGNQLVNGVNYIFAAEVTYATENAEKKLALVTINNVTREAMFVDLLKNKAEGALGYAFNWLK